MRKTFQEYYQPTEQEFLELWSSCIFVIDANVLLNMYKYSNETSDIFKKILNDIKDRIWIPNQSALEFQKNRLNVIGKQEDSYNEIIDFFDSIKNKIESKLNEYKKHPFIDIDKIYKKIEKNFNTIVEDLSISKESHPNLIKDDNIRNSLTEILSDKIGEPYTDQELRDIHKEAEKRFSELIPPGFRDEKSKSGTEKYGDYILWRQILDKSKKDKKPIILITDDTKDDWWWIFKGKTIGPRPELRKEIFKESEVSFYMYKPAQFMDLIIKYLKQPINKKAIDEVRNISKKNKFREDIEIIKSEIKTGENYIKAIEEGSLVIKTKIMDIEEEIKNTENLIKKLKYKEKEYSIEDIDSNSTEEISLEIMALEHKVSNLYKTLDDYTVKMHMLFKQKNDYLERQKNVQKFYSKLMDDSFNN